MKMRHVAAWLALAPAAFAQPADEAPAGYPPLGRIAPRSAAQIASSPWSIGGETLDRDYAVYANYRKFLGPLGAKHLRLQAGWAKCERTAGVYDWAWLDEVVNDARAQGVQPWLETSYGNPAYPGGGGTGLGGGLPSSPEALAGWDRWVAALVGRYKDRVNEWEIWNEPDLSKAVSADAYAALFIRTAETVRRGQPGARIYAMGMAGSLKFAAAFLARVQEAGKLGLIDAVTCHAYPANPDDLGVQEKLRELLDKYSTSIAVRQGETGAPSTAGTVGALKGRPWSELTQAKWDLRRMLAHRGRDLPFNLFTLVDLKYTAQGMSGMNTKGLLKANEDRTVAGAKPAYRAAQHVFTVFDDSLKRIADFPFTSTAAQPLAVDAYRKDGTKAQAVALWFRGAPPAESNDTSAVDFVFPRGAFDEPVYADLRTGRVSAIPKADWSREGGGVKFRRIPVYDSPVLIAEKSLLPLELDFPRRGP